MRVSPFQGLGESKVVLISNTFTPSGLEKRGSKSGKNNSSKLSNIPAMLVSPFQGLWENPKWFSFP